MARALLNLPINVSWLPIATSPDMVDTEFCDKQFPFAWRSSLAISAFEPRLEDLPEELCGQRVTYFKVTCTITGYQPSKEETDRIVEWPDVPTEELNRIIETNSYFACYGVLLNVAVFPISKTKTILKKNSIDFSKHEPGTTLPNPHEIDDELGFEAVAQQNNRIIDIFPAGGDGIGELDLQHEMVITFPSSSRVEAKVVHAIVHSDDVINSVTMEAFKGDESIGSRTTGPEQFQVHVLSIEGDGIDRVVFTAPESEASLLEFTYYVPQSVSIGLADYPKIIDFQPKVRDLYQTATETGEVLTASVSKVNTDKTLTNTESTETGVSIKGEYKPSENSSISGKLSHKWGETDQDQFSVQTDSSRERREREGTTTQLSQMYNLLTGYHQGTNRAVFLMLPRPHVLEPTDRRTFVQGLRYIEGVQEYLLIVSRPEEIEGLCIETFLETGHFSEDTTIEEPDEEFYESSEDFECTGFADNSTIIQNCENFLCGHTIDTSAGFVIDRRESRKRKPGDPIGSGWDETHPGIAQIEDNSNSQANETLDDYSYKATSDISVEVKGRICGERGQGDKARFKRKYRVFTRSEQPKPSSSGPIVPVETLIITSRGLCACIRSGELCPEVVRLRSFPGRDLPDISEVGPAVMLKESIVDERPVKINPALLGKKVTSESRLPTIKELLRKIHNTMATSWRLPSRYPYGEVGFLESDHFKNQILKVMPQEQLEAHITRVAGLSDVVVKTLGETCTVAEALEESLSSFARKTGLTIEKAVETRRRFLGLMTELDKDEDNGKKQENYE
jgi:hypothetical protein